MSWNVENSRRSKGSNATPNRMPVGEGLLTSQNVTLQKGAERRYIPPDQDHALGILLHEQRLFQLEAIDKMRTSVEA